MFIAESTPLSIAHFTASTARSIVFSTSVAPLRKTDQGRNQPHLRRAQHRFRCAGAAISSVPNCRKIDSRPLWPPELPSIRMRMRPSGRAKSSSTTRISFVGNLVKLRDGGERLSTAIHISSGLRQKNRSPFPKPHPIWRIVPSESRTPLQADRRPRIRCCGAYPRIPLRGCPIRQPIECVLAPTPRSVQARTLATRTSLLLLFFLGRGSFGRSSCGGGGGTLRPSAFFSRDDFRTSGRRFGHCGNRLFFHRRSKN